MVIAMVSQYDNWFITNEYSNIFWMNIPYALEAEEKGRLGHCCKSWWWLPVSPLSCWRRSNWRMFSKNSFGLCWWSLLTFQTFQIWPILIHHFMNFTWINVFADSQCDVDIFKEFAMYGQFCLVFSNFWGSMAAVRQRIWSFNSHYCKGSSTDWWDS